MAINVSRACMRALITEQQQGAVPRKGGHGSGESLTTSLLLPLRRNPLLGIVFVQEAEQKILINYVSRYSSSRGGGRLLKAAHVPLNVKSTGVMPIIFSTSFLHIPLSLARSTVAIFWDLDNKPPNQFPAYDAALRLKRLAGEYGEVVDMVAYANQNAFSYVPSRVREERQDRRMLDQLEKRGIVNVERPYICSMCGRKSRTNVELKRHFKQLHERERNKRLAFLGQLKGKKRTKFLEKVAPKESKYKEAARTVLVPKVGYGLASELKRAGVAVRTVEKRPQAADEALMRHMNLYINRGIEVICLVSDDSDFLQILRFAKSKHVWTIVIGDTDTLRAAADCSFSWEDVASGRAVLTAHERVRRWSDEDALRAELYDDEFGDDSRGEAPHFPDMSQTQGMSSIYLNGVDIGDLP